MKRITAIVLTLAILVGFLPAEVIAEAFSKPKKETAVYSDPVKQTTATSDAFTVYYTTKSGHMFQAAYTSGMRVEAESTFNVLDMDAATDGWTFTCTGPASVDPNGMVTVVQGGSGTIQVVVKNGNGEEVCRRQFTAFSSGSFAGGCGTADRPYLIANEEHFANIRNGLSAHYMLIDNIVVTSSCTLESFSGVLDGNGHSLHNLTMQQYGVGALGLIGTNNGTIKNLECHNFRIFNGNPNVYGTLYAGLLCGINAGTLENIYIYGGSLDVDVGDASHDNSSYIYAGALCGYNKGTIKKCGTVASSLKAVATTYLQDVQVYIGGLVGYSQGGSITDCYGTGATNGKNILGAAQAGWNKGWFNRCKGHGRPYVYAGGVIGYAKNATITRVLGYGNDLGPSYLSRGCSCGTNMGKYLGSVIGYSEGSSWSGCYSESADGNLVGNDGNSASSSYKVANLEASGVLNSLSGYSAAGWVQGSDGILRAAQNKSISVTGVKDQLLGHRLNLENAVIQVTNQAGGKTKITGGYKITGYDPNYHGIQTVTITYGKISGTFQCQTFATNLVTITCVDENGKVLQPIDLAQSVKSVKEGSSYSMNAPEVTGYKAKTATVTGTMGTENITHTVVYTPRSYLVSIQYLYESDGTTAADRYSCTRTFGEALTIELPILQGYKPMLSTGSGETTETPSAITIPADYAADYSQTVEYTKTDDLLYKLMVHIAGAPLPGVSVTFNGKTKTTAPDGSVVFNYSPGTETVSLQLQKTGYHGGVYQESTTYALKTQLGIDYLEMKLDVAGNEQYFVQGITCYGSDIQKSYGVINANYDKDILIYVKGNVPKDAKIQKMLLVQDVPDRYLNDTGDETLDGAGKGMIRKVLRTVNAGDENLTKTGFCSFWVKGTEFDHDDQRDTPIYVYMYVENAAEPVIQKLQIDTIKMQFNMEFENLFDNISTTLSGTGVEFLDGLELSLEMDDKYKLESPLSLSVQNNEIYILWDMTDELEDDVQRQETGRNSAVPLSTEKRGKDFVDKVGKSIDDNLKKVHANTEASFSMKASIAGGMCITVHEDGHTTCQSILKVVISANASWAVDFMIVVIPMTVEVSIGAEGELTVSGLSFDMKEKEILWPSMELEITGKLGLSAGFGWRVASAGVFCDMSAGVKMKLGEECYLDALILNGKGGFYAKLDVGLFELEGRKSWTFLDKTIHLAPQDKIAYTAAADPDGPMTYIGEYNNLPIYSMSAYALEEMLVEEELATWSVSGASVISDDVPEQADPRIVELGSQTFAFYYTQLEGRDTVNAKTLVYRIKTGGGWMEPMPVFDDGTSDSEYDVVVYEDQLYVVCTQANQVFTALDEEMQLKNDVALLNEVVHAQDVYIFKYDQTNRNFQAVQRITSDTHYDSMPTFGVSESGLYLAWNKNTATDETVAFGSNRENYIWYTVLKNDSWSEPQCLVNRCYPVADMEIAKIDARMQVAMIVDEDLNLYTEDDRNIYLADLSGLVTYVDCYGSTVSRLQAGIKQKYGTDEDILYWLAGDKVMAMESSAAPYQFTGDNLSITGDFRVIEYIPYGVTMLIWNEKTEEENQLRISYKQKTGTQWSAPASLGNAVPHVVTDWDAVSDGITVELLFTNTFIQTPETTGEMDLHSRSQLFHKLLRPSAKTIVTDRAAEFTEDGTQVKLSITISNSSPRTVETVDIKLLDRIKKEVENGGSGSGGFDGPTIIAKNRVVVGALQGYQTTTTTYSVDSVTVNLKPGCSKTLTVYMDRVEAMQLTDYDIEVTIKEYASDSASGSGDSSASGSTIGGTIIAGPPSTGGSTTGATTYEELCPDLSVTGEYVIIGEEEYVSLRVDNQGKADANGKLILYRLGADGKAEAQVFEETIEGLMQANSKYYLIRLEKDFFQETAETFQCVVTCQQEQEQTLADNGVEITARKLENQAGTQKDLLVQAPELSHYQQTFDQYAPEDVTLDITLNEDIRQYYGCLDDNRDTVDHTVSQSGNVMHVTFSKDRLMQLPLGDYEHRFFFRTDAGYIDALHTIYVVDNTPIPLSGKLEFAQSKKEGLVPVSTVHRGMLLEAVPKGLNTESVTYQWLVDGVVVADGKQFMVEQAHLGKTVQVRATGVAPYYGSIASQTMQIEKVDRWVEAPAIITGTDPKQINLQKVFNVGDNRLQYGYSTENDPSTVTNWSEDTAITLPEIDLYYIFAKLPETGVYEEAISESTAYSSTMPLKFAGASLSLHHNLTINYKVDRALFETYGYTDPYVVVEFNGKETVLRNYTVSGNRYVFTFRNIAPNQMADTLHATLYAKFQGQEVCSAVRDYSVTQYCYSMLELYSADQYAELRTLLVDLLHYGTAAQVYTSYKVDTPINGALTTAQLAWGTAADPALATVLDREYAKVETPKAIWKGAGLNLNESVSMRYKFTADSVENLYVLVESGGKTWKIPSSQFQFDGQVYYIYFTGLDAGQMRQSVYLTIYENDVAVSNTVCYSIESYAHEKQNSTIAGLADLVKAMMRYGDAAYAYAH